MCYHSQLYALATFYTWSQQKFKINLQVSTTQRYWWQLASCVLLITLFQPDSIDQGGGYNELGVIHLHFIFHFSSRVRAIRKRAMASWLYRAEETFPVACHQLFPTMAGCYWQSDRYSWLTNACDLQINIRLMKSSEMSFMHDMSIWKSLRYAVMFYYGILEDLT